MILEIKKSDALGCILAPPSKSMAHRYLICSMIARGISKISNIAYSDDVKATIGALKALGCGVIEEDYTCTVISSNDCINSNTIDCNESGSTLRFMIPILLTYDKEFILYGSERLLSRPLDEYEKLGECNGVSYFRKKDGHIELKGKLNCGTYHISSSVSSQFATGMIFALSMIKGDSKLIFDGKISSKPYIDMTIDSLLTFGKKIEWVSDNEICIYDGNLIPTDTFVEGDESNAAFLYALDELGGDVCVNGLNENTRQGDKVFKEYFNLLDETNPIIDIDNCPDLAPVIMALGAYKNGVKLVNTSRLYLKESSRGEAMKTELEKFGSSVDVFDNYIVVHKKELKRPNEIIDSHNDHRIAMALSVLMTKTGGIIQGCECVKKSYPNFYDDLRKMKIEIEEK